MTFWGLREREGTASGDRDNAAHVSAAPALARASRREKAAREMSGVPDEGKPRAGRGEGDQIPGETILSDPNRVRNSDEPYAKPRGLARARSDILSETQPTP